MTTTSGLTVDRIENMTLEELEKRVRGLQGLIKTRRTKNLDTLNEELDFCYLTRELEARKETN